MRSREVYRFGPFQLDADERKLTRDSSVVAIQPRVLDTLLCLVRNADSLVSREKLLDTVWEGAFVTDNVLTRCIKEARQALGDDARQPAYIRTIPRAGYRFEGQVRTIDDEPDRPGRQIRSIAVLPFRPLVSTTRDESLELGMTETLIARLSNVSELTVRPLSAVRRYVDLESDPIEAGRQQDVDAVLEGSLQRSGNKLRVTSRLLRTSNGSSIWAGRFDEEINDVFSLQDSIAARVLDEMSVRITRTEKKRLDRRHTSSVDAYQSYLLGRLHGNRLTATGARDAIDYFRRALELDPSYPLPHVGLAEAYISLGTLGVATRELYPRAREAALRALELDENLAEAVSALASIAWQFDWDHVRAAELFERSVELNPNVADIRIAYCDFCAFSGDMERALEQGRRALELDPISPNVNSLLAQAYYFAGQWSEAREQLERALEIDPGFGFAEFFFACVELATGDYESSIRRLERVRKLTDRLDFVGVLGVAYGRSGQLDQVKHLIKEVEQMRSTTLVPPMTMALLHLGLGDAPTMYEWLRQLLLDRSWHIHILYRDPLMSGIREEAEARKILREAGLM